MVDFEKIKEINRLQEELSIAIGLKFYWASGMTCFYVMDDDGWVKTLATAKNQDEEISALKEIRNKYIINKTDKI